mmetsp:Transcript_55453/g.145537  ORF Transcript_55453/g.145537 Transcript_55453/m.145537 type:complete len:300 (-) Transcript_55453:340-1239(-)
MEMQGRHVRRSTRSSQASPAPPVDPFVEALRFMHSLSKAVPDLPSELQLVGPVFSLIATPICNAVTGKLAENRTLQGALTTNAQSRKWLGSNALTTTDPDPAIKIQRAVKMKQLNADDLRIKEIMSANDAGVLQIGCGVAAANVAFLFWNVKELAATNAEQANLDLVYTSIERQRNDYLSLAAPTRRQRLHFLEKMYLKQVQLQAMDEQIKRATRFRKCEGFVGMIVGGLTIFAAIHYAFKKIVMWAMVVLGGSNIVVGGRLYLKSLDVDPATKRKLSETHDMLSSVLLRTDTSGEGEE